MLTEGAGQGAVAGLCSAVTAVLLTPHDLMPTANTISFDSK